MNAVPRVSLRDVTCRFGDVVALDQVYFTAPGGSVTALLGSNGAGKTTLLRTILGLQRPSSGEVRVVGRVPAPADRAFSRTIAHVPATDRSFYLRLSAYENLLFFARLHGLRRVAATNRVHECLEMVGLETVADRRVVSYSHGMHKRLAVARALLWPASVIVVDEATHDLDSYWAQAVRRLFRECAVEGTTVLWATQRLDEIRGFADRVTVLHRGSARFDGTVTELVATATTRRFLLRARPSSRSAMDVAAVLRRAVGDDGVIEETADHQDYLLALRDGVVLGDVLGSAIAAGVVIVSCNEAESLVGAAMARLEHVTVA